LKCGHTGRSIERADLKSLGHPVALTVGCLFPGEEIPARRQPFFLR
jgi:hypothetical protein